METLGISIPTCCTETGELGANLTYLLAVLTPLSLSLALSDLATPIVHALFRSNVHTRYKDVTDVTL